MRAVEFYQNKAGLGWRVYQSSARTAEFLRVRAV